MKVTLLTQLCQTWPVSKETGLSYVNITCYPQTRKPVNPQTHEGKYSYIHTTLHHHVQTLTHRQLDNPVLYSDIALYTETPSMWGVNYTQTQSVKIWVFFVQKCWSNLWQYLCVVVFLAKFSTQCLHRKDYVNLRGISAMWRKNRKF